MDEFANLSDFDNVFFYGKGELFTEQRSEILSYIIQPKRSLFYNRSQGAGIRENENKPNTFIIELTIRNDIIRQVGRYNEVVTTENPDRRIASSQALVDVEATNGREGLNVFMQYIPFASFFTEQELSIPLS